MSFSMRLMLSASSSFASRPSVFSRSDRSEFSIVTISKPTPSCSVFAMSRRVRSSARVSLVVSFCSSSCFSIRFSLLLCHSLRSRTMATTLPATGEKARRLT